MPKTHMNAGRLVATYIDDGQGRRLVIGDAANKGYIDRPVLFAQTQREAKDAIATLIQLAEELPP